MLPITVLAQSSRGDVSAPELRDEILEMARRDQAVQEEVMKKAQSGESVDASDWARIDSVFQSHLPRAKEILKKHQWPGFDLVGEEGSQSVFLIVQHADADLPFQKYALELLQKAFDKGQASGKNLAFLTDRVRVAEGHPQWYGTQLNYDDRACPIPGSIENKDEVDVRRAEVGMEPLDQYIANSVVYMGKQEQCKAK